jgi:hypothetical protein
MFQSCAKSHHIRIAPVFLPNGKAVPVDELRIRLDNAIVEVMFSLKHYYYRGPSGGNRFKSTKEGNTFTGTIEQVKILQVNAVIPSPRREPTMKTIQQTPPKDKNNASGSVCSKRPSILPPTEASPSKSKRLRFGGR